MGTACGTYGGERCILGFDGARGKETTWTKHAHEGNNKMNIQEKGGGEVTGLVRLSIGAFCAQGNEHSSSIKCGKFFDWLTNHRLS